MWFDREETDVAWRALDFFCNGPDDPFESLTVCGNKMTPPILYCGSPREKWSSGNTLKKTQDFPEGVKLVESIGYSKNLCSTNDTSDHLELLKDVDNEGSKMQDMDQGLVMCPELLPDDLTEFLTDEILEEWDFFTDFFSDRFPGCEDDTENNSEVPVLTDTQEQRPKENIASNNKCSRKRPVTYENTPSRPKRKRAKAKETTTEFPTEPAVTQAPSNQNCPAEILEIQSPSQPIPPVSHVQFITIPNHLRTLRFPISVSNTATPPAFIIMSGSPPHFKYGKIPPLSPVNGTVAPVQPSSSPSGSLSDATSSGVFPVCVSPSSQEMFSVSEPTTSLHPIVDDIPQTVKDYIQETKAHMSQTCDTLGDGLTLSSHYVDLKVMQRDILRLGKNTNKSLDKELLVIGETDRRGSMVGLNQIFDRSSGCKSKNYTMLVGKAGMGKTTCIRKLCLDWARDCIPQFDFVFLLDGKSLAVKEPTHNLQTLLLNVSTLAPSCSDSEAVFAQILAAPKRVLIIFDRFEDLRDFETLLHPLEKDTVTSLQKHNKDKTFNLRQLYAAILQRLVLPGCSLLLSSRPRGSASQLLRKVDNLLEVCGFSTEDVETYIKHYFPDPDLRQSAMNCLQNCSYLNLLCWNPGLCRLVCMILEQQPNLETLPRTLTGLCHQVLCLKMEATQRESQLSQQLSEEIQVSNVAQQKTADLNASTPKPQVCTQSFVRRASRRHERKKDIEEVQETKSKRKTEIPEENKLLSELSRFAWESLKVNSSMFPRGCTVSAKIRGLGLRTGLLHCSSVRKMTEKENKTENKDTNRKHTDNTPDVSEDYILSWANPFLHSYLAAVHLCLSRSVSDRTFVQMLSFQSGSRGRRRTQKEELEMTQRFAVGLLFHSQTELQRLRPYTNKDFRGTVVNKQKATIKNFETLSFSNISPSQNLDICHFVYEGCFTHGGTAKDSGCFQLASNLIGKLPQLLTFNGVPLCPADVLTIQNIFEHECKATSFCLDMQDSGIQISGLRSLVGLNITRYRACIADVITLWEELQRDKEELLLFDAVSKFEIHPFKATRVSHVEHLAKLVHIHTFRRLPNSQSNAFLSEGVPAVENLHKLEFELGPENGPLALPKLWGVLPGLHNLEHLDLENSKVGDNGAENLAGALVSLSSLQILNLSQNCIGDHGAKGLATALRQLPKLHRLSLYSNAICDEGAESLAAILPHMSALTELDVAYNKLTDVGAQSLGTSLRHCEQIKSLRMWSQCIPYGVFERLQQQDPRIVLS